MNIVLLPLNLKYFSCFFVNLGEIQNYFPRLELLNWAELIIG